jgi:hypothetical protein
MPREFAADRQPQPHAGGRAREPLVHLHERLEDALELLHGDPRPWVAHAAARRRLTVARLYSAGDLDAPRFDLREKLDYSVPVMGSGARPSSFKYSLCVAVAR